MSNLLIRNGQIVTADGILNNDILVEDGTIAQIAESIAQDEIEQVIDARGCFVMPGGIDPHVHMELPVGNGLVSSDDFYSGTRAALAGGTTTIIDFVTPEPGQTLIEAFRERKKIAEKSCCDFGFHMSVTAWDDTLPEMMRECAEVHGMTSFKIYLAYKHSIGLEDIDVIKVMDVAAQYGLLVVVHCEHGDIIPYLQEKFIKAGKTAPLYHAWSRPPEVEGEAAVRAIMFAKLTDCRLYIVHVSTKDAAAAIASARKDRYLVMGETCPHYLLLDEGRYGADLRKAVGYVMSPPLRPAEHKQHLWECLENKILQTVATDHCPFNTAGQKELGLDDFRKIPNGIAGVEDRLPLLYSYGVTQGRFSINRFVELGSTLPAKIFGLYPRKGVIQVGSDADIVVWDPKAEKVLSAKNTHQNCDTSVYEGFRVTGLPRWVIANGKVVVTNGKVEVEAGSGQYLSRAKGEFC